VGFEVLTAVIVSSHRKECGLKTPEDEALDMRRAVGHEDVGSV
jgi:hypothetical protein